MAAGHEQISITAKLAAYYRQFSDIPFAAEAAALVGADDAFAQLARDHGLDRDKLVFYAPMFEARYKSITTLILASGASQVLELASGYSLRGLDLATHQPLHYVETDLPDVVAAKRALIDELRLRHAIAPPPRHAVTAADALDLAQLRAATAPLDRSRPLLVLCEGLLGYLTHAEITQVADNVRALLADHAGGSWLVPDFAFASELQDLPPERIRLREAVTGLTQRQLDASAFPDANDLVAFLEGRGLDVQVKSQVDETPSFASITTLGLPPTLLDSLRPRLRVWVITPRA